MASSRREVSIESSQVRKAFGLELHLYRVRYGKSQAEWAQAVGVDPSMISTIENGKRKIPERNVVINWGTIWGLDWNERAQLLLTGHYLPELPHGFGTPLDRMLLGKSLRELWGDIEGDVFSKALISRCSQLIQSENA